jgi:hypothetical protein
MYRFFSEVERHSVTSLQDAGNATVKLRDASKRPLDTLLSFCFLYLNLRLGRMQGNTHELGSQETCCHDVQVSYLASVRTAPMLGYICKETRRPGETFHYPAAENQADAMT